MLLLTSIVQLLTECIFWTRPAEPLPFRSGRSRAGSRTRRSPRVEQVEPRLAVDGDQPLQQAVARLDGRPAVGAVAGLVHAPLARVAPPVRGGVCPAAASARSPESQGGRARPGAAVELRTRREGVRHVPSCVLASDKRCPWWPRSGARSCARPIASAVAASPSAPH